MNREEAWKRLAACGKDMVETGLTRGSGGNLSLFLPEEGAMWISTSGSSLSELREEDVVKLSLQGELREGDRVPSSEWRLHSRLYQERPELGAILHGHTIYATALSLLRKPLPASHYMVALAGGEIACADYATFGSQALAENACRAMEGRKAVLLANHGILTAGEDLEEALAIAEEVEYCARLYLLAQSAGEAVVLDDREMDRVLDKFTHYGQPEQE